MDIRTQSSLLAAIIGLALGLAMLLRPQRPRVLSLFGVFALSVGGFYLARFFELRGEPIVQRWHGIYAKHPTDPWVVRHPEPRLTVINGVGGNGMTLSFGLTGRVVRDVLA